VVPGEGWFDSAYLGIDQGPILLMIENYRSGFVWQVMRRNPYIRRGLERAGFEGGWLAEKPVAAARPTRSGYPATACAGAGHARERCPGRSNPCRVLHRPVARTARSYNAACGESPQSPP
jgi:hypothetical protein